MKTQLARSALWYARHGWAVFPLRPGTKEPFKGVGVYDATSDVTQVTAFWNRWPNANIGLHCGGSNLLAIDIDSYKDTYQGTGRLTSADEDTLTSITGSGGTHLLYAVEDGRRYGNGRGDLPPGIDVRGWGGYIVLPPSIHPNGNLYQWEAGYRPNEISPMPLPQVLFDILEASWRPKRLVGPPDAMAVAISLRLVESVLEEMEIAVHSMAVYEKTGRKLKLETCPFMPEENPHADYSSYVTIAPDGHIAAGCPHARCRDRQDNERQWGWDWIIHRATAEYTEAPKDEAVRPVDRYVSERTCRR